MQVPWLATSPGRHCAPLPAADRLGAQVQLRGILSRSQHGSENQSLERLVTSGTHTGRPASRGFGKSTDLGCRLGRVQVLGLPLTGHVTLAKDSAAPGVMPPAF